LRFADHEDLFMIIKFSLAARGLVPSSIF